MTEAEYYALVDKGGHDALPEGHTHTFQEDPDDQTQPGRGCDVAAKRALIKSTIKLIEQGWGYHGNEGIICADLRPMAEVYSDHPAFAEIEWE